jgi:hypothetical protein
VEKPVLHSASDDRHGVDGMQTPHELFVHEPSDMLDAERKLVEVLGKLLLAC